MAIAFVYNALGIFFRSAFDLHDKYKKLIPLWLVLDYLCDIIYLVDIIAVQFHLSYSDRGLLVVWIGWFFMITSYASNTIACIL